MVPIPVGRLIIFDTKTTRLGTLDRILEIDAVKLFNEGHPAPHCRLELTRFARSSTKAWVYTASAFAAVPKV